MHDFGEKTSEFIKGNNLPVIISAKYKEAKAKAIEIIDSGKFCVTEGDFWILKNTCNGGKSMMYSGLIISHNGCLKINDAQDANLKVDPESFRVDKEGYGGSLVYSYCNKAQGIYEVGEVAKNNCQNSYPYAMAYKRCFDRVVLKLSKLAYNGVYSDSEAEEFRRPEDEEQERNMKSNGKLVCEDCHKEIKDTALKSGAIMKAIDVASMAQKKHGRNLCASCMKNIDAAKNGEQTGLEGYSHQKL